jgi:hypothetical protein
MIRSLHSSNIGTSLLLAVVATGITAAVVFGAGALVLPDTGPNAALEGTSAPAIDNLTGSQAIVAISGAHEGRYELNHLAVGEWNEGTSTGDPLKLSLTFRGDLVTLLITAQAITADAPATGDAASVTVGVDGGQYFGNDGQCTVTIADLEFKVLEPQPAVLDGIPRGVPIPIYAGTVECVGIDELRSDDQIDLHAAFRHQPED